MAAVDREHALVCEARRLRDRVDDLDRALVESEDRRAALEAELARVYAEHPSARPVVTEHGLDDTEVRFILLEVHE